MTFDLLGARIAKLRTDIPIEVNRATKEVAREVLDAVVQGTPVDTTKALSNWQVGIGSTPQGEIGPKIAGKAASTHLASKAATINDGIAAMQGRTVGTPIHIANNASYIVGLNDGSISNQPGAFVEAGLLAGRLQVQKTKLKIS